MQGRVRGARIRTDVTCWEGPRMSWLQNWRSGARRGHGDLPRAGSPRGCALSPLPRVDSSATLLQSPGPWILARTRKR